MSSPVSYTATIEGWFSEAADCASRRNRAWNVWSRARSIAKRLHSDNAVKTDVAGPEDLGHASSTDDSVEFVAAAEQPWLSHVAHFTLPSCSSRAAASMAWPGLQPGSG